VQNSRLARRHRRVSNNISYDKEAQKKKIHRQLIKLQNKFGKVIGRAAWQQWKAENRFA
jgi:hypothetical protein